MAVPVLQAVEAESLIPSAILSHQPERADSVWTRSEWGKLSKHLHNDNDQYGWVMGFRETNGEKKYVRSKSVTVDTGISWAWSTITAKTKRPLAFVPYSQNDRRESRWGGMDFDAHDGNLERARRLAFAAFRCLLNDPQYYLVLETTGSGGYHLFIMSEDFRPIDEWIRLLKSIAHSIDATIVRLPRFGGHR